MMLTAERLDTIAQNLSELNDDEMAILVDTLIDILTEIEVISSAEQTKKQRYKFFDELLNLKDSPVWMAYQNRICC